MQKFLSPFPAATTSTPSMVILGHKNLFTSAMIWLCTAFELVAVLSTRGKNQKAKHLCVPNIFYFLCKNMLFVYKQNLFKILFLNYIFFPAFFSPCVGTLCAPAHCAYFSTLSLCHGCYCIIYVRREILGGPLLHFRFLVGKTFIICMTMYVCAY